MVIQLLGPSLETLFDLCGQRFSLKTTLMVFFQFLERLEHMHKNHMIHHDLKPSNTLVGLGNHSSTVHLIDFGLTRLVVNPETGQHVADFKNRHLVGSSKYCSINAHLGTGLTRRDDLISLGYVILEFVRGGLPWQFVNIDGDKKEAYKQIALLKKACTNQELCEGLPPHFLTYMNYVTGMSRTQAGDFEKMKKLVMDCACENSIDLFDNTFDWSILLCSPEAKENYSSLA